MQDLITPTIKPCPCGGTPRVVSDDGDYSQRGGYGFMMRVECSRNCHATKYCGSSHRAICKWNNKIDSADRGREAKLTPTQKINK